MTLRPAWHESAACDGADLGLFFASTRRPNLIRQARAICHGCPVSTQCLRHALNVEAADGAMTGETRRYGIYGGTTPAERAQLATRKRTA